MELEEEPGALGFPYLPPTLPTCSESPKKLLPIPKPIQPGFHAGSRELQESLGTKLLGKRDELL